MPAMPQELASGAIPGLFFRNLRFGKRAFSLGKCGFRSGTICVRYFRLEIGIVAYNTENARRTRTLLHQQSTRQKRRFGQVGVGQAGRTDAQIRPRKRNTYFRIYSKVQKETLTYYLLIHSLIPLPATAGTQAQITRSVPSRIGAPACCRYLQIP